MLLKPNDRVLFQGDSITDAGRSAPANKRSQIKPAPSSKAAVTVRANHPANWPTVRRSPRVLGAGGMPSAAQPGWAWIGDKASLPDAARRESMPPGPPPPIFILHSSFLIFHFSFFSLTSCPSRRDVSRHPTAGPVCGATRS